MRGSKRALYAVLSPVVLLVSWQQLCWSLMGSYGLFGWAYRPAAWWTLHVLGAFLGAALVIRRRFVPVYWASAAQTLLGVVFSISGVALFLAFGAGDGFHHLAYATGALLGGVSGLCAGLLVKVLPVIAYPRTRLLDFFRLEVVAAFLLSLAAHVAGAHFLGPLRMILVWACVQAIVAHLGASLAAGNAPGRKRALWFAGACAVSMVFAIVLVDPLTPVREAPRVADPVIAARNGRSQRYALTSGRGAFQYYQNGVLRFSTIDSYRLKEAAVLPLAAMVKKPVGRALVIGGPEGLLAGQLLTALEPQQLDVVHAEPKALEFSSRQLVLRRENRGVFSDKRVSVQLGDPNGWLGTHPDKRYDAVVVDLPEPTRPTYAKVYTRYFLKVLAAHMNPDAVGVIVTAEPLQRRRAFWCLVRTAQAAGLSVLPYRGDIPTIGRAGFLLFGPKPLAAPRSLPPKVSPRYLTNQVLRDMFLLAPDEQQVAADINLLYRQPYLKYRKDPVDLAIRNQIFGFSGAERGCGGRFFEQAPVVGGLPARVRRCGWVQEPPPYQRIFVG